MAIITFSYTSQGDNSIVNTITVPQRAKLAQLGGDKRFISFPYGPQGITYDGIGLEYSTVERPGLKPLLEPTAKKQRTIAVIALLATPQDGGKSSVEDMIDVFVNIANESEDCAFTYGVATLPYRVRLTQFSYTAIQRDLDGNITQAEINLQLDERILFSQSIVALKAITYAPDPVPDSAKKKTTSSSSSSSSTPTASTSSQIDFVPWNTHNPYGQP